MKTLFAAASPSPNEDAHSKDILASNKMNDMLDIEDRLKHMLDACP
jgi:hypothetical protein